MNDRIVALKHQVLDLGCLFRHLVFGGGEGIGCRDNAGSDCLLGHLVPAAQHRLPPGVPGVIVRERDLLVLGVCRRWAGCQRPCRDCGQGDCDCRAFHAFLPY
jgi:hypothetical protein